MKTKNKEPKFIQITNSGDRLYALDKSGGVWVLDKFLDDDWKWLQCVKERITEKSLKKISINKQK